MLQIELRPRRGHIEYAYPDATFTAVFNGKLPAAPPGIAETLTCTITHGLAVNNANGALAIQARGTSVITLQGQVAGQRRRFFPNTNLLVQAPAFQPQQSLRIRLVFFFNRNPGPLLNDDYEYTGEQSFDIPIGPDWFGEIHLTLTRPNERIESFKVPLARRGWGLPAAFGSAYAPLQQLQELQRTLSTPPELESCMAELRKWLRQALPRATYPVRANNGVKFYNDASQTQDGTVGAFADIHQAMANAKHFIFIADWSFHPDVYLMRPAGGPDPQHRVGNMLINKALQRTFAGAPDANVDPNILIAIHTWNQWDLPSPMDPLNNNALQTLNTIHQAMNVGGQFPNNLLWRATERSGVLKSHHQKFVVLDAPVNPAVPGGQREIKVFFGGLDLTTGRFDWPEHPIDNPSIPGHGLPPTVFQTFGDWYNAEFAHDQNHCRQPWHDIHAQLVGPSAWDFVTEFVGRWSVGAPGAQVIRGNKDPEGKVWQKFQELLSNPNIVRPFDAPAAPPLGNLPRIWSAQVYRSMEKKFWHEPGLEGNQSKNAPNFLRWGLDKDYEKSIHKAYLQAIKRADRFIYIESQYLISGDNLKEKWTTQGHNHIPTAIVNRIAEKYAENTPAPDFHVYIILPMFPEGSPIDGKLRPVRYFQWETIRWMKRALVQKMQAIDNQLGGRATGKTWQDYLSFYFLGNRTGVPTGNAAVGRAAKVDESNRYMIYVHSKLMIVDDEWVIIGSANLNERSMSGRTDSEICAGMWATPGNEVACKTEIQAFRERLWREHLGDTYITHPPQNFDRNQPQLPATYRAVRIEANDNRDLFVNGYPGPMQHLMLWDLDDANFAGMLIPDSAGIGDEWRVQPSSRGIAMLAPNEPIL
ncbi:MAG TPA: phospholipase D-like domain-containing protein [Caldilineaceae bacterium]|nr:phospholipase D-like domain-containing protein [Caldilineaceae bacterium]